MVFRDHIWPINDHAAGFDEADSRKAVPLIRSHNDIKLEPKQMIPENAEEDVGHGCFADLESDLRWRTRVDGVRSTSASKLLQQLQCWKLNVSQTSLVQFPPFKTHQAADEETQ